MEGSHFSWLLSCLTHICSGSGSGSCWCCLATAQTYSFEVTIWQPYRQLVKLYHSNRLKNCFTFLDHSKPSISQENWTFLLSERLFLFSPNFGPESIFMRKWASPALAPWSWLWTYSFALHCGVVVVSCHGFICRAGEGRGERAVETFTYDIHLFWIFWPAPPCHVHKSADFASLVCFLVIPLPPPSTEVTCACPPRTLYGLVKMLNRGKWSCRICFAAVGRRTRFFRGSIPFQLWLDERPSSQLGAMCVIRG